MNPSSDSSAWICCQIGAREHYAIPQALHNAGQLHTLVTDVWCKPGRSLTRHLNQRMRDRYHPDLKDADIRARNLAAVSFSLNHRAALAAGWPGIIARNEWFQASALRELQRIHRENPQRKFIIFSYSYAASQLFAFAKDVGWTTVLGQIDPGPAHERIVAGLQNRLPVQARAWKPAPAGYWQSWRSECDAADRIIVNSEWTREGLAEEGIPAEKIQTVPLVAQEITEHRQADRVYPDSFSMERPLRLLFLGQAGLGKGIHLVIEAAEQLRGLPVEISIVGPIQIDRTPAVQSHPVLRWFGSVPRSQTGSFYQAADAFLFPTLSDGFGLTQLEAQSWGLPLIVSRFCGEVVHPGVNGLVVDPLSADNLVSAIRRLLDNPGELTRLSRNSKLSPSHRPEGLASRLRSAVESNQS